MKNKAGLLHGSLALPHGWMKGLKAALSVVAALALLSLACRLVPSLGRALPAGWEPLGVNACLASLAAAASLALSLRVQRVAFIYLDHVLAVGAAAIAASDLLFAAGRHALDFAATARASAGWGVHMAPAASIFFVLLAVLLLFIRARQGITSYVADCALFGLIAELLVRDSWYLFSAWLAAGAGMAARSGAATLFLLTLLGIAAIARRAEFGALSVVLSRGVSGRIMRRLAPIMLFIPMLREAIRFRLLNQHWLSGQTVASTLASVTTLLWLGFLLVVGWRILLMERAMQDLSLRDDLTGLYNLRGFRLLSEQALLLARRVELPFSVLFIDLDNLKEINDTLGHAVGSSFLVETAELLKASFRETDVVGRVGGDEFAIAGQFSRTAISIAAIRLEEQAALSGSASGLKVPLRFSIGYVTSELHGNETLEELLVKADAAMYDRKRRKKLQLC